MKLIGEMKEELEKEILKKLKAIANDIEAK